MSAILPGDAARLESWRALADDLARHSDSGDGPMESRAGHAAGALRGAAAMVEALIAERPDVTELQILAFAYAEAHASYRMAPCDAYSRARAAALGDLLAAVCGQEVAS